jgi:hypothetical protein
MERAGRMDHRLKGWIGNDGLVEGWLLWLAHVDYSNGGIKDVATYHQARKHPAQSQNPDSLLRRPDKMS